MIPVLYSQDESDYGHNGIGVLSDVIYYTVTEEANGEFELYLEYPVNGRLFHELQYQRLIKAKPNDLDADHVFRIYEIVKDLESHMVYIYATSKTNDLGTNLVKTLNVQNKTAQEALNLLKSSLVEPTDFNFVSDITTKSSTYWEFRNPLSCIVGEDNSLVKYWGGEVKRTNDTIYLYSRRGRDNVTVLREGKNIKGLEFTVSIKGLVTKIVPYFIRYDEDTGEEIITIGNTVSSPLVNNYPIVNIIPVDYTLWDELETAADLNAAASGYFTYQNPGVDKPKVSLDIDMMQLSESSQYKEYSNLESLIVFDSVTVYLPKFDVNVEVRVNKVVYNGLLERADTINCGDPISSLFDDVRRDYTELIGSTESKLINIVQKAGEGSSTIFRGPDEPVKGMKPGDLWYKPVGGSDKEMYQWTGAYWELILSTTDINANKELVDTAVATAEQAKQVAEQSYLDSVAEAERLVGEQTDAFDAEMTLRKGEILEAKEQADLAVSKANSNAEAIFGKLDVATYEANKTAVETELGKKLATATYNAQKQAQDALIAGKVAIDTYNTKVSELNSLIAEAQTTADTAAADILDKADTATVNAELAKKLATSTYNTKMTALDTAISGHNTRIKATEDGLALTATKVEVDAVRTRMSEAETEISQNSDAIALKASQSSLDTTNGKLATAEASLVVQASQIASKVSQTDFNALNGRVSTAETTITQQAGQIALKASQLDLDAATGDISDVQASLTVQAGQIASKVSQTDFNALNGRVGTAETSITANTTAIGLRATKSDLDATKGRLTTAEGTITAQAGQIALRATTATVNALTGRVSAAEASLVVQSGKIDLAATKTELTTAIDDVQVGGRNLFKQTNQPGMLPQVNTASSARVSVQSDESGVLTFTLLELNDPYYRPINTMAPNDDIKTGMKYAVSGKIYVPTGSNNSVTIRPLQYVGSSWIGGIYHSSNIIQPAKKDEWVDFYCVFEWDNDSASLLILSIDTNGNTIGHSHKMKDLKLEMGNKATSWTPAPEDVDAAISTVQSNLTVEAGKIASKVSQTDFNALSGRMSTAETTIVSNTTAINLRATKSSVDTLTGRVTTAEGTITTQAGQIALRATTATVNALTGRVSTAESTISANTTAINLRATKTELTTAIDGIQVGGRNVFTKNSTVSQKTAVSNLILRGPDTPNGFRVTGLSSGTSSLRIPNVIDSNGWWTVSFSMKGNQNVAVSVTVDICDKGGTRVTTSNTSNLYERHSVSVNVTNYTSDVFNFVDFDSLEWKHYFIDDLKIEKGNKATEWTPAPEDVDAAISTVQSNLTVEAGKIAALTTRVGTTESNITSVTQTVSGINTTISTLRTDVNGKATIVALNQVKTTADGNKTTISNHAGRLTTVETNVNGLQTTVSSKADKSQITQLSDSISSTVSTAIDGIEVGGRNLIAGTSEEASTLGGYPASGYSEGITGKTILVPDKDSYVLSFYAKSTVSGDVIRCHFYNPSTTTRVVTSTGYTIIASDGTADLILTNQWKKYWVKYTQNGAGTTSSKSWIVGRRVAGLGTGTISVKGIKLEEGNKDTDWTPAPEDVQSQITQLSTDINLRVTKGSLMSEINVQAGRTIISTGKLYLDTGSTIMTTAYVNDLNAKTLTAITANITSIRSQVLVTDSVTSTHIKAENALIDTIFGTTALITRLTSKTAFITNIQAINISADKITTGTLNASNVNIINLNVSKLVGDTSNFVKSAWNGLNTSLSIDSTGLKSYTSNLEIRLTAGYTRYYISNVEVGYMAPLVATADDSIKALGIVVPSGGRLVMGRQVTNGVYESLSINGDNGYIAVKRPLDFSLSGVDLGRIYGGANGLVISSSGAEIQFFQGGTSLMYGVAGGLRMYRQINMNGNTLDNASSVFSDEVATPILRKVNTLATDSLLKFTRAGVTYSEMLSGGFRMHIQLNMNTNALSNVGTLTYASDARYKSNITTREVSDLDIIRNIRYVDFTFNRDGSRQRGLIAQELMKADSKLVTTADNGYLSYDSQQYTHAIGHGLQELDVNVRDLRDGVLRTNKDFLDKIAELENKIQQLEEKLA